MGRTSLVLGVVLTGCGGGPAEGTATAGASSTGDETGAVTSTSQPTTSASGVSDSESAPTTSAGSESQSGSSTGDSATTAMTASSVASETTTDATTGDATTEDLTASESGTSDGTTIADDTTGTASSSTGDAESSTGEPCVPLEEVCNDVDDNCDGQIDNVDVGKDGICDCLNIALVGNEGANPSAEFQAWLEAQGTQVDRISTMPNEVLDKATLNKYDIIVLDYLIRNYTADEQSAVQTWVEAGGGLMAMTGFTNVQFVADRPNSLIQPMGLSYNTSKGFFSGPVTQFAPHEITKDLTSISFYGGLFVDIVQDGIGVNEIIMTLPQGPVGVVQDRKDGRLFIFGDEWVEFDSEWKNIPQIKQFWVQTLSFLGPKESCQVPQ